MKVYLFINDENKGARLDPDKPILTDVKVARSFFERLFGLILKKELAGNEGLLFEDCSSIHTFWMRFPLDVIFLDSNYRILRIFSALKPFRITPLVLSSKNVLELKGGVARELGLKVGDMLGFQD